MLLSVDGGGYNFQGYLCMLHLKNYGYCMWIMKLAHCLLVDIHLPSLVRLVRRTGNWSCGEDAIICFLLLISLCFFLCWKLDLNVVFKVGFHEG